MRGVNEINWTVSRIGQYTQKQAALFEEVTAASCFVCLVAKWLKRSTIRVETGEELITGSAGWLILQSPARPKTVVFVGSGNLADVLDVCDEIGDVKCLFWLETHERFGVRKRTVDFVSFVFSGYRAGSLTLV